MVYIKTYISNQFYYQYLALLTMFYQGNRLRVKSPDGKRARQRGLRRSSPQFPSFDGKQQLLCEFSETKIGFEFFRGYLEGDHVVFIFGTFHTRFVLK